MPIRTKFVLNNGDTAFGISLPDDDLVAVLAVLPDTFDWAGAYEILANHGNFEVRKAVAVKASLTLKAMKQLVDDPAIAVVKQLLTRHFDEIFTQLNTIERQKVCQRDPELALLFAEHFGMNGLHDETLLELLENHRDSLVRRNLAANPYVPDEVLRRMAVGDENDSVRNAFESVHGLKLDELQHSITTPYVVNRDKMDT
ncbi:MAG: hypothetical protein ABTQ25_19760 [Nitrosomonas ureae]